MKKKEKKLVSQEALFFIKNNMIIGLGEGSTVRIFIKFLGKKVKKEKLKIKIVPVSKKIEKLCRKVGLKIVKSKKIDIAIDGADKINDNLEITKGFGAFEFVNEKKLDYQADKVIILADSRKFVKNVLDYDILIKTDSIEKLEKIASNVVAVKGRKGFYKIRVDKKKIKNLSEFEDKLEKIGGCGLFTKFKQLIVIGINKKSKKTFIKSKQKFLQVAIDVADEKKGLFLIEKTKKFADIIEIGTPLIELAGVKIIKKIKTNNLILADIKAADVGAYGVSVAVKNNADIISILAGSSNTTIMNAVKESKKFNKKVLVDLIDVKNKERVKRLKEILKLKYKPDIVCVHVAIDVQGRDKFRNLNVLSKLCKKNNVMIALAGGINKKKIKKLAKYGPDIFIIGGAITKAVNPEKMIKELKKAIKES